MNATLAVSGCDGASKLVDACTCPLTGRACVSTVYTDHAVVDVGPAGARVRSTFGTSLDELRRRTGLDLAPSAT